ncbi:MAG TPA: flap endonuclease Xni [Vicinamibacteria bacterium]|nr:flap endonuclease Xni [Vicinamibacteria bacterium]
MHFLVVDALNLIRRIYAATPADEPSAHFDSALDACRQSLRRALNEFAPSHAVAVFDGEGPTWRHQRYDEYKAGRKPMPEPLRSELIRYRSAFSELGVASVDKPCIEADDVMATLAEKIAAHNGQATILSTDTAFCQLVSDRIRVWDHFNRRPLDAGYVAKKFLVRPEQLVDLWALAGSSTTHIPGVPGVGIKTAARLVTEHGDLDRVLGAAPSIGGRLGQNLQEHADRARLSRELARLRTDLELGWSSRSFRLG